MVISQLRKRKNMVSLIAVTMLLWGFFWNGKILFITIFLWKKLLPLLSLFTRYLRKKRTKKGRKKFALLSKTGLILWFSVLLISISKSVESKLHCWNSTRIRVFPDLYFPILCPFTGKYGSEKIGILAYIMECYIQICV